MKNMTQFLSEVQAEVAKVVWPSYEELVGSVAVVLLLVFFFALYLWGVDLALRSMVSKILAVYGVK